MAKSPQASVVIPAYNEATYIGRLLEALSKQNFKDFEVIVSDAQSKDGTKEVVGTFRNKLDISFMEAPPRGPAHGRNMGAAKAKGEWLLFLDADDDIDDPDFMETLLDEAASHNWNSASTKMKVKGSAVEKFATWFNYRYTKLLSHTKHPVAAGWCILTRRNLFEKLNGFNEKIQFGEDYDYVTRAGSEGFGYTDKTYYYMDLRRARGEGLRFVLKGIANEIYRHTHGYNMEKNPIKYEFGKHKKRGD